MQPQKVHFKIDGYQVRLHDVQNIALELEVEPRDLTFKNGILAVSIASQACHDAYKEGSLPSLIALALDIDPGLVEACNPPQD